MRKKISEIVFEIVFLMVVTILLSFCVAFGNEEVQNDVRSLVENNSVQLQECNITAVKVGSIRPQMHDELVTVRDMLDSYGFPGMTYFRSLFKTFVGIAPGQYRKKYKKATLEQLSKG